MTTSDLVLLHLSLIPKIGPATVHCLIASPRNKDLATFYHLSVQDFCHEYGLTPARARLLVDGLADHEIVEKELMAIEKHQARWMTIADANYPSLLRAIHLPPTVLYWQGARLQEEMRGMAIVGSRKANSYAQRTITLIVPALVAQGYTIVSGGALGVDSMAHEQALQAQGRTCIVLGSGLANPYPPHNKKLFDRVCEQEGTLLSMFPIGMRPEASNFPARNRVIAGLASSCLVVQAAASSGALITAQFAVQEGRTVYAIPGPIDDPLSAGCHTLIQQGATLVTSAAQLLSELGHEQSTPPLLFDAVGTQAEIMPSSLAPADPIASRIVHQCSQPTSFDDLMELTALGRVDLHERLFELQLAGLVAQTFAGLWQRC